MSTVYKLGIVELKLSRMRERSKKPNEYWEKMQENVFKSDKKLL